MRSLRFFHAGTQRADAADDQVDLDAGLSGRVERFDDALLEQRIHLGDDARRPPGRGVLLLRGGSGG